MVQIHEEDVTDDSYACFPAKELEDFSTLYRWGKRVWEEVTEP